MAFLSIPNVKIAGVSAAVPKQKKDIPNLACFAPGEAEKVMSLTGVRQARICPEGMTCSDLSFVAAEKLIAELGWAKEEIDAIVYVPLSRDYYLCPSTAAVLQDRLGLSKECYAIDVPLACSGYVYGLSVLGSLIATGGIKKALLFVGETTSFTQSPLDKQLFPLHGDGATATALVYDENAVGFKIHTGTDGSHRDAIITPEGGTRKPFNENSLKMIEIEPGVIRNGTHSIIDGMGVFNFSMTVPPRSIKALEEHFEIEQESIDYFLIHQANKYLIDKIVRKIKAAPEKVLYSLGVYGNISSGTIPLTMVTQIREQLQKQHLKLLGCGFGSGLSWGSIMFETEKIAVPELIEL